LAYFKLEPTEVSNEKVNKIKVLKKKHEGNSNGVKLVKFKKFLKHLPYFIEYNAHASIGRT
jgi:hypothetical protein